MECSRVREDIPVAESRCVDELGARGTEDVDVEMVDGTEVPELRCDARLVV